MAIRDSSTCVFNGINCADLGLVIANISNGLQEEPFMHTREIREVKIPGNDKPYLFDIDRQPLSFTVTFLFTDKWTESGIRAVARWLNVDNYKSLIFSESPDRIFYAMPFGDTKLMHNTLSQGYVTVEFRCDSAYSYSAVTTGGFASFPITLYNSGDVSIFPEVWIRFTTAGSCSIVNASNGDKTTTFTDLANQEIIYYNAATEDIVSDISGMYRYSHYNNVPLELVVGENVLQVTGNVQLQFRYQLKYL